MARLREELSAEPTARALAATVREAMRVREAGNLAEAVAMMRGAVDPTDSVAGLIYLRVLFEYQDYATLQRETRRALGALSLQTAGSAGAEYLGTVLHFAERCCLPFQDVDAALDRIGGVARKDPALLDAWRAVRRRQRHRRTLAERYRGAPSIVSLGLNCLPWHLPGRWGLRREEDFASLFVPFSLAGHTVDGIITALEGDFSDYCAPDSVRAITSQRGHEFVVRKDRSAFWNHNRGAYWLKDDMAALRADIARKAANFRAACGRPDVVFLLATCPVEYPREPLDFLPRLQAALARFTGTEANRVLITNQTARREAPSYRRVNETTAFVYCCYPRKEYVWHDDAAADASDGVQFERGYVSLLLRALLAWNVMQRIDGAAENLESPGGLA